MCKMGKYAVVNDQRRKTVLGRWEPYLESKSPTDPLFTVEDSVNELKAAKRAAKKTLLTPSQIARDKHRVAYRRAIQNAIKRANKTLTPATPLLDGTQLDGPPVNNKFWRFQMGLPVGGRFARVSACTTPVRVPTHRPGSPMQRSPITKWALSLHF